MQLSPEGQKLENMLSWCHSGFHVYIGDRIFSDDKAGLGNLAPIFTGDGDKKVIGDGIFWGTTC
jgi:hypothetical protein